MVQPDYMARQDDINHKMRVILTDWLVEVHLKFRLRNETLFLCFQLMDRFLQDNLVVRNRLQVMKVSPSCVLVMTKVWLNDKFNHTLSCKAYYFLVK